MINLDRNKLLNQITYLSIFKINKMPKTMNSVMFFHIFPLISSAVYLWYIIIMVTELYQNTVSQCAKNEKRSKYHSLIYQGL